MKVLLALIAMFAINAYTLDYWKGKVENGVDYWNTGKSKVENRDEFYKVLKEQENWFPQNTSPLERYFYKHPEDRRVWKELYRFYSERTDRANKLQSVILYEQAKEELKLLQILKNYEVLYFYSPHCPYCRATEPLIGTLSELTRVYRINVELPENRRYLERYQVLGVPTLVFVRKGTLKEVKRWTGMGVWDSRFKRFLLSLEER